MEDSGALCQESITPGGVGAHKTLTPGHMMLSVLVTAGSLVDKSERCG